MNFISTVTSKKNPQNVNCIAKIIVQKICFDPFYGNCSRVDANKCLTLLINKSTCIHIGTQKVIYLKLLPINVVGLLPDLIHYTQALL